MPPARTTTPFEQAKAVYDKEPCRRTFWEDVSLHFLNGFVFSTPDFFVMGRPVIRCAAPEFIVNPAVVYSREVADTWHVYLFAGDAEKAWAILPWPLEFISMERDNELRFFKLEDILRHTPERAEVER